jgi:nicotinamidase-related amidase
MVMWSCGSGSVWIHWIRQNLAHPKAALIKKPIPERIAKTISTIPIFFVRDIYLGPDNHFIPKRTLILAKLRAAEHQEPPATDPNHSDCGEDGFKMGTL